MVFAYFLCIFFSKPLLKELGHIDSLNYIEKLFKKWRKTSRAGSFPIVLNEGGGGDEITLSQS